MALAVGASDWNHEAVVCLLERYSEKFSAARGYLRTNDWEEVVSAVNSLCVSKTMKQCRDKIDSLKRRYKIEKRKASEGARISWPYFELLDQIMASVAALKHHSTLPTIATATTNANSAAPSPSCYPPNPHTFFGGNGILDKPSSHPPLLQLSHTNHAPAPSPHCHPPFAEKQPLQQQQDNNNSNNHHHHTGENPSDIHPLTPPIDDEEETSEDDGFAAIVYPPPPHPPPKKPISNKPAKSLGKRRPHCPPPHILKGFKHIFTRIHIAKTEIFSHIESEIAKLSKRRKKRHPSSFSTGTSVSL